MNNLKNLAKITSEIFWRISPEIFERFYLECLSIDFFTNCSNLPKKLIKKSSRDSFGKYFKKYFWDSFGNSSEICSCYYQSSNKNTFMNPFINFFRNCSIKFVKNEFLLNFFREFFLEERVFLEIHQQCPTEMHPRVLLGMLS